MSVVTGVVLCTSCVESSVLLDEIDRWLEARSFRALSRLDGAAGGSKHPQMWILGSGFNYFGSVRAKFITFVMGRAWHAPDNVVLVIEVEDEKTTVHRPGGQ